jgi:hypothetical protein
MTRINVEIVHAQQRIILFADCSHPDMDVEELIDKEVALYGRQPTRLLASLIDQRYPSDGGGHRAGERILALDMESRERDDVLRITFTADGPRVDRVRATMRTHEAASEDDQPLAAADRPEIDDLHADFAAGVVQLLRLARATQRASGGDRWRIEVGPRPGPSSEATWPEDIRWRDES